ncbi:MAG: AbrB/MazE/SpoVT family DNA-binding domain-containing protein [Pseudomonadota bacterium]|nr:AbrB/MazE/SpoVT family DNA-binding domain-containing protein [Pseudomonadota bacterium]
MTNGIQTRISNGGRIVIPAMYRKSLGLSEGEPVTLSKDEFAIRISTPRLALRRLQALAAKRIPKGRRVSEELIAERRAEAKRELEEMKRYGKKRKD